MGTKKRLTLDLDPGVPEALESYGCHQGCQHEGILRKSHREGTRQGRSE